MSSLFKNRRNQIVGLNKSKISRWIKLVTSCCVAVFIIFSLYYYIQQPLKYLNGQKALENNDYNKAFSLLMKIPRYKDSMIKIQAVNRAFQVISDSEYNIVGIRADGSVSVVGRNDNGQCEVRDWKDIIAISAGTGYTVGLKVNRTVVATKFIPSDELKYYGQCEVSNWKDIIEISTGIQHTVGLKSDGTVVAVGSNEFGQCDVSAWKDIVAVSAGAFHTVGLKSNGTVLAIDKNEDAQCDVSSWKHIVKISAGWVHTVGLLSDGSVVAVGNNVRNQCDVKKWKNIVSITSGGGQTVGLKKDGKVVFAGSDVNMAIEIAKWNNIVAISSKGLNAVGLQSDGKVIYIDNILGEYDISDWNDIIPRSIDLSL